MAEVLLWLTMTVYFEGRSEPVICQEKIARVVLNRMKDGDIKKVILAPYQSCHQRSSRGCLRR